MEHQRSKRQRQEPATNQLGLEGTYAVAIGDHDNDHTPQPISNHLTNQQTIQENK